MSFLAPVSQQKSIFFRLLDGFEELKSSPLILENFYFAILFVMTVFYRLLLKKIIKIGIKRHHLCHVHFKLNICFLQLCLKKKKIKWQFCCLNMRSYFPVLDYSQSEKILTGLEDEFLPWHKTDTDQKWLQSNTIFFFFLCFRTMGRCSELHSLLRVSHQRAFLIPPIHYAPDSHKPRN